MFVGICLRLSIAISALAYIPVLKQSRFKAVFVMAAILAFINLYSFYKCAVTDSRDYIKQLIDREDRKFERPPCKGAVRLGDEIELQEEIYTSLLVSCLDPDEIRMELDEVNFVQV